MEKLMPFDEILR